MSGVRLLRTLPPLLLACACAGTSRPPQPSSGLEVLAEVERLAQLELWPGFDPSSVPVALYDGRRTLVVRHPSPPAEFLPLAGSPGVLAVAGRHPAVAANAPTEIGGQAVAGVLLGAPSSAPPRVLAATVLHEAFHVFQRRRHPEWTANEVDLFAYPVRDVEALALRGLETAALRQALSTGDPAERGCHSAAALDLRSRRFAMLPASAVDDGRAPEGSRRGHGGRGSLRPASPARAQGVPRPRGLARRRLGAAGGAVLPGR